MKLKHMMPWRAREEGENGHPLLSPRSGMETLFENFMNSFELEPFRGFGVESFNPKVDVTENEAAYTVAAELPGLAEKDIEVLVDENVLTIKGEKKAEKEEKKGDAVYMERSYGSFSRRLPFPVEIDTTKIKAHFEKGVLMIELPKTEKAKASRRKIPVSG
jgi:HSP20 family protein